MKTLGIISVFLMIHISPCAEITKQRILSTCVSEFENLYFNVPTTTFLHNAPKVRFSSSFNLQDPRGYRWQENPAYINPKESLCTIPGTTLFAFERTNTYRHSAHFYHFLEHLLALWHFGGEAHQDDIHLFVIANNGCTFLHDWQGPNEISFHLIKALFPKAVVLNWEGLLRYLPASNILFERVLTSDRGMEHWKKEPYYTDRMIGDYFQLLQKESIDHFVSHVWQYCGVQQDSSEKIRITYIARQDHRKLRTECEQELFRRLKQLPNVELNIVDFAPITFNEQLNIIANTDVLMGVHGNGLTHTLLLPEKAALIEFFPAHSFAVEFRILAGLRHLQYFAWIDQEGWVQEEQVRHGTHGAYNEAVQNINIDAIVEVIQKMLQNK